MPPSASLLLTKQMESSDPFTSEGNRARWEQIASFNCPSEYRRAYPAWQAQLRTSTRAGAMQRFRVDGRLLVGVGAANVLENSIAMHRLWGVPIIPGSALKGLARHYSASELAGDLSDDQRLDLFGGPDWASNITWLDAWYVYRQGRPFRLEVVTPHHGAYYEAPGRTNPPWDFTDPKPSTYASAQGEFLVALLGPTESWVKSALEIITRALKEWGVGAKSSSGYGVLLPDGEAEVWPSQAETLQAAADALVATIADADPATLDVETVSAWIRLWTTIRDRSARIDAGVTLALQLMENPEAARLVAGQPFYAPFKAWMDEHEPGWEG